MDKLQWGNRKRLRCMKVKDEIGNGNSFVVRRRSTNSRVTSRVDRKVISDNKQPYPSLSSDFGMNRSCLIENRKIISTSSSPEKEDRFYTTRGSLGFVESAKLFMEEKDDKKQKIVWPKLCISLSSKEKEEDFMAMKGCKLPQRPKKRAKLVQRTLLLVSPGAWLSDLCQERYEVREKKTTKKRPRGLKAMGNMESDSE